MQYFVEREVRERYVFQLKESWYYFTVEYKFIPKQSSLTGNIRIVLEITDIKIEEVKQIEGSL